MGAAIFACGGKFYVPKCFLISLFSIARSRKGLCSIHRKEAKNSYCTSCRKIFCTVCHLKHFQTNHSCQNAKSFLFFPVELAEKYNIVEYRGQGGFGVVFKIITPDKRAAALKWLDLKKLQNSMNENEDEPEIRQNENDIRALKEEIEREFELLRSLNHPNILKVQRSEWITQTDCVIVMDLASRDLRKACRNAERSLLLQ